MHGDRLGADDLGLLVACTKRFSFFLSVFLSFFLSLISFFPFVFPWVCLLRGISDPHTYLMNRMCWGQRSLEGLRQGWLVGGDETGMRLALASILMEYQRLC